MNGNRPGDRGAAIRLSNLRGKVGEGWGKGEISTKGLVCMHISLTRGHGQQGVGIHGEGFGMGMGGEDNYVTP